MNTVRKNITMPENIYDKINNYAKKNGLTFSEFLRTTALEIITRNEQLSLLDYLNFNCDFVDDIEQKEIENLNIDFENFEGKEITLDELLRS